MSEFIAQLFTDFTTADSLIILAFLFGAFLIGLFAGRASLRGRLRKLNKELQQQTERLTHVQTEKESLLQTIASQEENLSIQSDNLKKAEAEIRRLKQEVDQRQSDWQNGRVQIQQLEESNLEYQNQITALETNVLQSQEAAQQWQAQIRLLEKEKTAKTDLTNTGIEDQRLQSIENKLSFLERENQQLQVAIEELQTEADPTKLNFSADEIIEVQEGTLEELAIESEDNIAAYAFVSVDEKSKRAKVELKKYFGEKLSIASAEQKDPLQNIEGIGPFIEEQLNNIGIFTFQQISQFDDEIINLVTNAIQFFPGRIKRDNWQGQASKQLLNGV